MNNQTRKRVSTWEGKPFLNIAGALHFDANDESTMTFDEGSEEDKPTLESN